MERRTGGSPRCSKVNRRGQAFLGGTGTGAGGLIGCNIHGVCRRVVGEGGSRRRGEGAGRTVPVPCSMIFTTVGTAGGGGHATVEDGAEVTLLGTGGIRAAVLRLRVRARTKRTNSGSLAALLDMAKLPAVAALGEGGGGEGAFDGAIASIEKDKGGIGHEFAVISSYLDHHRAGPFACGARRAVRVEIASLLDEEAFGVVDGGAEVGEEEGVVIRHSLEGEAVNGELKISGSEAKGLPGVVGHRESLVESGSEGVEKRRVRGGGDRGVDNGQGNRPFTVDEGFESDRELGVGLPQNRGCDVG